MSFCGARKRDTSHFLKGVDYFFYYCFGVRRNFISKRLEYVGLEEYMHKFGQDSNFRNLNFLFNILYLRHGVGFRIMCTEVDKKYRKKLQTRYLMKLVYLSQAARRKYLLKIFTSFVLNSRSTNLHMRFFNVFSDGLFGGVRSEFFIHKKRVFEYLLKRK